MALHDSAPVWRAPCGPGLGWGSVTLTQRAEFLHRPPRALFRAGREGSRGPVSWARAGPRPGVLRGLRCADLGPQHGPPQLTHPTRHSPGGPLVCASPAGGLLLLQSTPRTQPGTQPRLRHRVLLTREGSRSPQALLPSRGCPRLCQKHRAAPERATLFCTRCLAAWRGLVAAWREEPVRTFRGPAATPGRAAATSACLCVAGRVRRAPDGRLAAVAS